MTNTNFDSVAYLKRNNDTLEIQKQYIFIKSKSRFSLLIYSHDFVFLILIN